MLTSGRVNYHPALAQAETDTVHMCARQYTPWIHQSLESMQFLARHFFLIVALIAGAVPFARDMSEPVSRQELIVWLLGFVSMAIYVVQTLIRLRRKQR